MRVLIISSIISSGSVAGFIGTPLPPLPPQIGNVGSKMMFQLSTIHGENHCIKTKICNFISSGSSNKDHFSLSQNHSDFKSFPFLLL
jgi:hypothetical protein